MEAHRKLNLNCSGSQNLHIYDYAFKSLVEQDLVCSDTTKLANQIKFSKLIVH